MPPSLFSSMTRIPSSPLVRHGLLEGDRIYETDSFWNLERMDDHALLDVRLLRSLNHVASSHRLRLLLVGDAAVTVYSHDTID